MSDFQAAMLLAHVDEHRIICEGGKHGCAVVGGGCLKESFDRLGSCIEKRLKTEYLDRMSENLDESDVFTIAVENAVDHARPAFCPPERGHLAVKTPFFPGSRFGISGSTQTKKTAHKPPARRPFEATNLAK